MAKVVITKDRDTVGVPTKFLAADGTWKSVANKQEFNKVAKEVKMEYNQKDIDKLIESIKDEDNVKVNLEMSIEEYNYSQH